MGYLILGFSFLVSLAFAGWCSDDLRGEITAENSPSIPSKIEYDHTQYEAHLADLYQNMTYSRLLSKMKEEYGGEIPEKYAAAIAALRKNIPIETTGWTSPESLTSHFHDHGAAVFAKSIFEYEQRAIRFSSKQRQTIQVIYDPHQKVWVKYDASSHEFLVMSHSGAIITYFVKSYSNKSELRIFENFLLQNFGKQKL